VVAEQVVDFALAPQAANDARPRDRVVVRAVAAALASSTRMEALEHNRAGRFAEARGLLRELAARLGRWAQGDPELERQAQALAVEADELARRQSSLELKQRYYASHHVGSSRDADQRSRRKGR
jgi:hypothetical protein